MAKAKNEAKIRFLAETSDFRENVNKAASTMSELSSELKLNAEQMKTNGTSADALAERQKLLQAKLEQAQTKTENLSAQMESCTRNYGENSTEVQRLSVQINNAKIAEEKIKQEIAGVTNEMGSATTATDKLEKATQDSGEAAEDANDGFTVWKGTLADLASNAIQSVWSSITGLASSFWNLGDETRELRTNMNKVETAFESAGLSADNAAETYEDFYGILADEGQATEAVNHLAKLVQSQEDLSEWTDICTGVYATFGDSLPIEGLTEAANETIKTGKVTGNLADALNWSTMSSEEWAKVFDGHPQALKEFQHALENGESAEDAFNAAMVECTTEAEREQVLRKALTGLYGDAADAYAETSGEIIEANKAQAAYNNALAGLGEIIEPIKTAFVKGMASMLESVTELISGMDMEGIKNTIKKAFDYINDTVFPAIKKGIQWLIDNKDIVIAGLSAIVAGIAAFKVVSVIQTAVKAFKAFQAAQAGVTLSQRALNLVMAANPIGIVIAAVTALVVAFIYLWNNCEEFRQFWFDLWDSVKAYIEPVWQEIVAFFEQAWETIKIVWAAVQPYFSAIWENIKTIFSVVASTLGAFFSAAWEAIKIVWDVVVTYFSTLWENIKLVFSAVGDVLAGDFSSAWEKIKQVFANWGEFFQGLFNSMSGIFSNLTEFFATLWTNIWSVVVTMWEIIKTTIIAVWEGIKAAIGEKATAIVTNLTTVWNNIKATAVRLWNSIKTSISKAWDNIKTAVSSAVETVKTTVSDVWNNIKTTTSSVWNNIKTAVTTPIQNAKATVSSIIETLKTSVTTKFNSVLKTVTTVWNNIKSAITSPIESAKETIKTIIDKIKGFLDFKWEFPKLKMPHFKVSGSANPFDWFSQGVPKLTVEWYAKGGILNQPTIFGVNGASGKLMGGGEAGKEAVAPIDVLLGYVREAVSDVMSTMTFTVESTSNVDKLESRLNSTNNDMGRLIDAIEDLANRAINLDIDGMRFATATAGASDSVSGNRLNLRNRGLAL